MLFHVHKFIYVCLNFLSKMPPYALNLLSKYVHVEGQLKDKGYNME